MNRHMLAAHFDNWVFLLLVAVAMLFRWLASAAGKASKSSDETLPRSTSAPSPAPSVPRRPIESDTDRMRKFLEALGQPPEAKPPPQVAHRTDIPLRPVAPVRPPARGLPFPPKPRSRKVITPEAPVTTTPREWLQQTKVIAPVESAAQAAEAFVPAKPVEAYTIAAPSSSPVARIDIVSLLGSAKGLREAIILREIFGPPRSLQPLDSIGSA
jgi:hypothetical protein